MDLTKVKFILDENVPLKLKQCFSALGLDCDTIKDLELSGSKDKKISTEIHERNAIFVTRDRHFTFFWDKRELKIVYIAIEPSTLEHIAPRMSYLLENWKYDINHPFLITLQSDAVRFWQSGD